MAAPAFCPTLPGPSQKLGVDVKHVKGRHEAVAVIARIGADGDPLISAPEVRWSARPPPVHPQGSP